MANLLTEKFVQDSIITFLTQNGWSKNIRSKTEKEHGVDIKVRNDKFSRYFLIEVKGDASAKAKYPRSHREVNFNLALGQIITRMQTNGVRGYKYRYKYGVGYPISFREIVLRRLSYDVCDKLNLYLFFVNHEGAVEMFDWRGVKAYQGKINLKRKS
ncbi:DUF3883 domain-containing protein [Candidatus Roizmanbacteria bacterium]|nr:DUF3883 domain-containing protein [Candidatus Roizmanbacteria bacterium]